MYEDKNTWKQHYEEWIRFINRGHLEIDNEYRYNLFKRLIKDYEVNNG